MNRYDTMNVNLQMGEPKSVPNVGRQDKRDFRAKFADENSQVESENENDQISMTIVGRMRNREDQRDRRPTGDLKNEMGI